MTSKKELLNKLGEFGVYIFVLSLFLDGKLNLKVGYFVQAIFLLKLIFDRKDIINKWSKIYTTFVLILILGIIMNLIASSGNGWDKFFSQNIKFLFGFIFVVFIDSLEKLKKALIFLLMGTTIISFSEVSNLSFIDYSISRGRPLIMMGAVFSNIYFFEKIKNWIKIKKIDTWFLLIIPMVLSILGIIDSGSRMGFIVYVLVVGVYALYNLSLYKIKPKKIILLFLGLTIVFSGAYLSIPLEFKERIKTSFQTKNNISNEARLVMWNGGLNAFKSRPLTGVGSLPQDTRPYNIESAKNYGTESIKAYFIDQKNFSEYHNIYINFLAQNGLILSLIYLYLFFIQIPKLFLKNRRDSLVISTYGAVLSFLIYGVTWSVWTLYSGAQILFQIFLGILICLSEKLNRGGK